MGAPEGLPARDGPRTGGVADAAMGVAVVVAGGGGEEATPPAVLAGLEVRLHGREVGGQGLRHRPVFQLFQAGVRLDEPRRLLAGGS